MKNFNKRNNTFFTRKIQFFSFIVFYFLQINISFSAGCHVTENSNDIAVYPPISNYLGLGELYNPFCSSDDDLFFCSNIENGLKLIHNFEYSQGIFNFKIAQKFQPNRAISYALELFSYHQFTGNSFLFNKEIQEKAKKLLEFIENNKDLITKNDEEKDFIDAIKSFYKDEKNQNVELSDWNSIIKQNKIFEEKICNLTEKYPENLEFISFCGLSMLRTRNGGYDLNKNKKGVSILKKGYEKNPKHPGILHYLIHIVENPIQAHHANKAGNTYADIAYNSVHALHMPAHYFFNTGEWSKIIEKTSESWNLGEKMKQNYNLPIGSIDNFHGMRWIIYANLQLGKYDEAFLLLKKLIETGKDEYLNDGVIFDFSQSVALTLLEGDLQSDQRDYLLSILQDVELSNDKFSKIYLTYVNAIIDYRNGNVKNFDKYIKYIEDILNSSKDGHPMSLFNFKIMHAHMIVYRDILKGELEKAEKNATNALEIENEYVKTIFETGPVISLVPSNELLGIVLMKQNKFQDAINEFLKVGLRFPNRLIEKKYIEECYEKLIHQHRN